MENSTKPDHCIFAAGILQYLLPPVLLLEFVFGLLGNSMALWVFCFHIKSWKPSTILLANLNVADFLLIICLPFRTEYYLRAKHWVYDDASCRLILFMLAMNRVGSIVFLTAVAVDRYFKVVHPHHRINFLPNRMAALKASLLWILSVAVTVHLLTKPHLHRYEVQGNISYQCDSFVIYQNNTSGFWRDTLFIAEFSLPCCIIFYCSYQIICQLKRRQLDKQREIKKAVKFIFAVAVVFVVSFLPSVVSRIYVWILQLQTSNCATFQTIDITFYTTVCLTYFSSALDPLVYYFSSSTFKLFFKSVLHFQKPQSAPPSDIAGRNRSTDAEASRTPSTVYL
ncbi:hydroxycarboxylic acid receptor 3-like [Protopterus annectens]|uniref:hydroxycarboxylic acid receptor 3-like n=1 Tax=Protopterus annectens TaxID=7888 RepID=UPI001CF95D91|nr:hydroxycarboxylic acid receptor 3-like [Protopterus annectens]